GNNFKTADTNNTFTGVQPKDKYGFAVMGGISVNIGSGGDKAFVETAYTQGTPGYAGLSELDLANSTWLIMRDNRFAVGWAPDAVFFNAGGGGCTAGGTAAPSCSAGNPNAAPIFSGIHLTTVWTIAAAYEHYWTPAVRTSIYGVFTAVSFDSTAKLAFCDTVGTGAANTDPLPQFQLNSGGAKNLASTGVATP